MPQQYMEKLNKLKEILRKTEGCAVAFSGGVDSTLLLAVAREVLGEKCLAVIATAPIFSERESNKAIEWVNKQNIPYIIVNAEELEIPDFTANNKDRCYHCKKEVFGKIIERASSLGLNYVADGTNADDTGDYRPGLKASSELGVLKPMLDAGLTKNEIRAISNEIYHLPTADKPSMACLASRFPYGSPITSEKLKQVDDIERFLDSAGFRIYRARHHGDILRLELGPDEMAAAMKDDMRKKIIDLAKNIGFLYVTMDIEGFRSGSLNEALL
ncbi:ATP-dependent sacrificial sulfur transferase LarE [Candidatus Latescibacterota bacterium]